MVRNYKRVPGSRPYGNHSPDMLEECVQLIQSKKMSQRQASRQYGIARGTLQNRLKQEGIDIKRGHPTALTNEEEIIVKENVLSLSSYGFPLTNFDLRCLVKSYLDRINKNVTCFKNNMPGKDWALSFVRRHEDLTTRFAANIKLLRAQVNPETISAYCDNLKESLEGIPKCNIWNFDETNLTDDPGQKKIITKRGCKYPERVVNSSKASISVMFCANAEGRLMPPYVVYRSQKLWNTWIAGGPKGCKFNRSKSGWFDTVTYEDWFEFLALPILVALPGTKVLIGDNLTTHLSKKVIELCEKHDVKFICLPPNSTHLTQPLDVAFFRPLKIKWRQILDRFKTRSGGALLSKDQFPRLLCELMTEMEGKTESVVSGFRKCGICPVDKRQILSSLPGYDIHEESVSSNDSIVSNISDAVIDYLSKLRYGGTDNENGTKCRRKKVNVEPGKSVESTDFQVLTEKNGNESNTKKKRKRSDKNKKRTKKTSGKAKGKGGNKENSDENCDSPSSQSESDSEVSELEIESYDHDAEEEMFGYAVGSFVIVEYEGEFFPGEVKNVDVDGSAEISTMSFCGDSFYWPAHVDQIWYDKNQIKEVIAKPVTRPTTSKPRKETFCVPEITKYRK